MNLRLLIIAHAPLLRVNRPAYRCLAAMGWQVRLIVPENTRDFGMETCQPEEAAGLEISPRPFIGRSVRTWTLGGLEQELQDYRPQVVLVDGEPDSQVVWQLVQHQRTQAFHITVMTCENLHYTFTQSLLALEWKRAFRDVLLGRLLAKTRPHISHVFTLGSESRQVMQKLGFPAEHTSIIPLGFDETAFHPDEARGASWRHKLGLEGLVIGYFGRLIPEKGVHVLIQALATLKDLPFTLLMDDFLANNDYQKSLHELLDQSGLRPRTKFAHVSHEEMPGCLNAVDIVAVPSLARRYWREQYGRVLPEAMASGCAVVASRTGTLPELMLEHGLLVEPESVSELAEALRTLITEPEKRARLAESGCRHAQAHLSASAQAALQHEVLLKLTQKD